MTIQTQELQRVFKYNSVDLLDPGIQYTPEQVRDFYAPTYPEILNAAIEGPEEKDGKIVWTFRRAVGTKGARPKGLEVISGETALVIDLHPRASAGVVLIAAERKRQMEVKRWSARHDDEHTDHSLAMAACAYAAPEQLFRRAESIDRVEFVECWPSGWLSDYDKRPRDSAQILLSADSMTPERRIRQLAKAGALIAAEIDRLTRMQKANAKQK